MTPHQILAVCVRLLSAVLLLYTLSNLHTLFMVITTGSGGQMSLGTSVAWIFAILQLGFCMLLWFFPRTIALKLLPGKELPIQETKPPRLVEWQTLGVICIGLWALSIAIPDIVYWAAYYGMAISSKDLQLLSAEHKASMLCTVVRLVIGVWLLLGAKGFAEVIFRLRTAS